MTAGTEWHSMGGMESETGCQGGFGVEDKTIHVLSWHFRRDDNVICTSLYLYCYNMARIDLCLL